MGTPARPGLRFATLDEMAADVDHLRAVGCTKAGNWDLGMILDHVTKQMVVGFSDGWMLPWPLAIFGRRLAHGMVARDQYPKMQLPAMPFLRPTPGADIDAAYGRFTAAVDRLQAIDGPTMVCWPTQWMRTADYIGVQRLHGAHHLAFLQPNEPRTT